MEYDKKEFLLYLMYMAFIDLRARAFELNEKVIFYQCDLFHNVPLAISYGFADEAYENFLDKIKHLGLESWLAKREFEFHERNNKF